MVRVGSSDKGAAAAAKQIVFAHITQDALAAGRQSAALQFGRHGTMAVVGHLQSDRLNCLGARRCSPAGSLAPWSAAGGDDSKLARETPTAALSPLMARAPFGASLATWVISCVIRRFQSRSLTTFLPRASARLFLADRFPWLVGRPCARGRQCGPRPCRPGLCREKLVLCNGGVADTTAKSDVD